MNPTHEQITKVAEALAEVLARDYEELVNFVQSSLEAQYEGNYECFLEDWHEYVGSPVDMEPPSE